MNHRMLMQLHLSRPACFITFHSADSEIPTSCHVFEFLLFSHIKSFFCHNVEPCFCAHSVFIQESFLFVSFVNLTIKSWKVVCNMAGSSVCTCRMWTEVVASKTWIACVNWISLSLNATWYICTVHTKLNIIGLKLTIYLHLVSVSWVVELYVFMA
jgi:hypothetical protein